MSEDQKRAGRPRKPEGERKRGNLTFRVRGDTYDRLSTSAGLANRSLSEEIEYRLTRSFEERDIVSRALGGHRYESFIKALGIGFQMIEVMLPPDEARENVSKADIEIGIFLGKLIKERLFYGNPQWAELLSDVESDPDRQDGPGAAAAKVACEVLGPSPRRARSSLKF